MKINASELKQARPFAATRLLLLAIFCLMGLFLICQLAGFILSQRKLIITLPASQISAALPSAETEGKLDINTASAEELDTLPGIGPALAGAILDFRSEIGGFHFIEELMDVQGIGEKKFSNVQALIYCSALKSP